MSNVLEELEKQIKTIQDDPHFLVAYLRYMTVFRNLAQKTTVTAYVTAREFSQYIHYRNKYHSKPTCADAIRDMSISLMKVEELSAVTESTVAEYLNFLDTVVRNMPATIERKIRVMRLFYHYLIEQQTELGIQIQTNPFLGLRVILRSHPATIMSHGEIQKLLSVIEGENAVRDRAIILLILSSALRLDEVAQLDIDDVGDGVLTVRGTNPRVLDLNEACVDALEEYIRDYRTPIEPLLKDNALFVSQARKKRLTPRRIQQAIGVRMNAAGFMYKDYSASTLRDTAVQMLLDACDPLEIPTAMRYLGYRASVSSKRFSAGRNPMSDRMRNLMIGEE